MLMYAVWFLMGWLPTFVLLGRAAKDRDQLQVDLDAANAKIAELKAELKARNEADKG